MPCPHKFAKYLRLEHLDFCPTTLIVGTFNPGWDNLGNTAPWFYGRTRNNYFWDVLPRLYHAYPLRQAPPSEWRLFCKRHRIAITDLIASINDADEQNPAHAEYLKNYRDDLITRKFKNFTLVDIPALLAKHSSIKHVYLTRSVTDNFWRQLWQPIENYCQNHEIKASTLLTPSGSARFQMPKEIKMPLGEFIFNQWRQNWHKQQNHRDKLMVEP